MRAAWCCVRSGRRMIRFDLPPTTATCYEQATFLSMLALGAAPQDPQGSVASVVSCRVDTEVCDNSLFQLHAGGQH